MSPPAPVTHSVGVKADTILKALVESKKSNMEIKESQSELQKSLDFCSAKFDEFIAVTNRHTQEISEIKEDMGTVNRDILHAFCKLKTRNLSLQFWSSIFTVGRTIWR